jgi:RNA polymerase sigma-70 factor (ECF subfamily)
MAAALLERVARGEPEAFPQCVDAYGNLVWSLARRLSPTSADAEDAVQDIFLQLWKAAARYDPARGTEAVFIATLARRLLIDRHRERRRRPVEVVVDDLETAPVAAWASVETPEGDRSADAERAAEALRELPQQQQRVIAMSVVEGLSQSEIASATGLPLGTVKTLMRRGLLRVRGLLGAGAQS